jgi:ATP-dependent Clp protease ATP-binding subunit ClpC
LASRTGIPVDHITAQGVGRCEKLEADLNAVVVGQSEAIAKVSQVLKRAAAGLQSPDRPLGSFLFLGPSGVGKTLLAQTIARQYFGDEDALIRVDMSEFSEGFTVSKLLGSPAGYVGHKDDVRFVEQIRKRPYAVVLFDELEKAHPDVFQLLLQLLDEGRLTDATGRELNFRHTVVIMTSNIGLDALNRQAALGFSSGTTSAGESMAAIQKTIAEEVSYILPQEFLNRIDYQMIFQPLTEKMVEQIVKREFVPVAARAKQHGIKLHLSAAARKQIAVQAFNPDQGARLVRRTLAEVIETPLADLLLSASVAAGDAVNIVAQDGKIVLQRAPAVVTKKPLKKKMKKRASVTA